MKYLFYFLLIFSVQVSFSQAKKYEKPNYKRIKKEVHKKKSDFYYDKLLKKYNHASRYLSLKEKRHLYYGFVFQKNTSLLVFQNIEIV